MDDSPDPHTIIRSEEELRTGTRTRTVGRVRLQKRIVTEWVEVRVQVRREELEILEETVADGDVVEGALDPEDEPLEIVLYAEEPMLDSLQMRRVPRERVVVHRDLVTERFERHEEVRREIVEAEADVPLR